MIRPVWVYQELLNNPTLYDLFWLKLDQRERLIAIFLKNTVKKIPGVSYDDSSGCIPILPG